MNSTEIKQKVLGLVRARGCPRCGGDLSVECDVYGVYIECIQCGATWNKNDLKLVSYRKEEPSKTEAVKSKSARVRQVIR